MKAPCLKDEALEHENPIFTTSELINGVRCLFRKFGYQGDNLEHIQGNKDVDIKEMDKIVKRSEEQKATTKKGDKIGLWVGKGGWDDAEGPAHNGSWVAVGSNH